MAQSSDWTPASRGSDGAIWYVDVTSRKDLEDYPNGRVRKAWVKVDYSSVKQEPAREAKVLFFFKCVEERAKTVTWINYKPDGSVLNDISPRFGSYDPVVPETVLSGVMRVVCNDV
jgi:hypothetical protein